MSDNNVVFRDEKKARLTKRFQPKTWKPIYDQMVYFHCIGRSNIWIAEKFGYTPQQVCNVLTCDLARAHKKLILHELRGEIKEGFRERLEDVADKFMKRIEAVANDDELFEKSPFAVIDRGFRVLSGLGHIKGEKESGGNNGSGNSNPQIGTQNNFFLSDKAAQDIREGMQLAKEVRELYLPGVDPLEVKPSDVIVNDKTLEKAS